MNRLLLILLYLITVFEVNAQELKCNLTVNTDQIRSSENQIFTQLQQDLTEFVNNKRWTEHLYKTEEKIEFDLIINIKSMKGQTSFVADVMIQSSRPVYGTDYSSPVFTYVDENLPFQYQQGQPLYFVENNFTNNLTSAMAFYVYLVLGFDYDSFEKNGGSPYFDKANEIMIMSQQSGDNGWTADGKSNRDRYNLITQIMNPQYSRLREGYYTYHRLAFDNFEKDQAGARKKILEIIKSTETMNNISPNPPYLNVFYAAKVNEITNLFTKGTAAEKQQVLKILEIVDPVNMDKYNKMKGR